jgi:hypothetical protein
VLAGWGAGALALPGGTNVTDPAAITAMAQRAREAGAHWLALPIARNEVGAVQLAELDAALAAWGLPGLVAPLLRCGWRELGRLGVAYDVDFARTIDCGCGQCATCDGKARACVAAGFGRVGRGRPGGPELS